MTKFTKPTIEEITEYCAQRGNSIDPEAFYYFYESKDWMIGKNKMKSWQAAVITWEKRDKANGKSNGNGKIPNYKDINALVEYGTKHGIPPKAGEEAYPYWQRVCKSV